MSAGRAVIAVFTGFAAGMLSGLFGVGGGSIMTPALSVFLGLSPLVALTTPLPVILPTAAVGANNYRLAGMIDWRACRLAIGPGLVGAVFGAMGAEWIGHAGASHALLLITALIVGWESVRVIRDRSEPDDIAPATPWWAYSLTGLAAGLASGALGVGGGIVMVPVFTAVLGMPLKKALGTSLCVMVPMVIPGTIVHSIYGNIDWAIAAVMVVGLVPGAAIGSRIAIATADRRLRTMVGSFLLAVAIDYGTLEIAHIAGWKS